VKLNKANCVGWPFLSRKCQQARKKLSISHEKLASHYCLEAVDHVPKDPETTEFKRLATGALNEIVGTEMQQIWLDHLLALSMLQDDLDKWTWVKFVLVHPAKNPSFAVLANDYTALLTEASTFEVRTIESLLDNSVLPVEAVDKFRRRYIF
jgi:hypothetical protein